jgi:ATP-dependent exoDNAse (exonuclease V) beta subunit
MLFNKDEEGICFTLNCDDDGESKGTFLSRLIAEELDRDLEEEKRSLYVATTRASDMLILTFSGKKGRNPQPWKNMIIGNMLEVDGAGAGAKPAAGFEHLIEVIEAPVKTLAPICATSQNARLDTRYIKSVTSETFKEYVSPTAINEASTPGWKHDLEDDETTGDADRGKSQARGSFAHKIMEAVGNESKLEEVLHNKSLIASQVQIGIEDLNVEEVCRYLSRLKDHPLVKEMEAAQESRSEYQIIKPFGRYILSGWPDKVIKTAEGWKILDFKFSSSERHSEAYEFQMKFYLYLAREIFSPLLGAELFYLKDGGCVKVRLDEEEVRDFEKELLGRIEGFQKF